MAHPAHPSPKNQGSAGRPYVQQPRMSGKPSTGEAPTTPQTKRGYHSRGQGGTGHGGPRRPH